MRVGQGTIPNGRSALNPLVLKTRQTFQAAMGEGSIWD